MSLIATLLTNSCADCACAAQTKTKEVNIPHPAAKIHLFVMMTPRIRAAQCRSTKLTSAKRDLFRRKHRQDLRKPEREVAAFPNPTLPDQKVGLVEPGRVPGIAGKSKLCARLSGNGYCAYSVERRSAPR